MYLSEEQLRALAGFIHVGGYRAMIRKYYEAVPHENFTIPNSEACIRNGFPREDGLSLLRAPVTSDLPWTGMTFGLTINAVWHWCTDQVLVRYHNRIVSVDRSLWISNLSKRRSIHYQGSWMLQVIVQRALAAKDYAHAKGGCILAAGLKFLPLFLIIFPGMIARVLFKGQRYIL